MGVLDAILGRLGYVKKSSGGMDAPAFLRADAAMACWSIPDGSLFAHQAELYQRLSWVQTAIGTLAGTSAVTSLNVKRRDGERLQDIPNHPFEVLLQRPNPKHSRYELLESTFAYRRLTGNAYWWLNRSGPDEEPSEIWIIPPHKILPIPDGQSYIKGYAFFPEGYTGQTITTPFWPLDTWEIVHFSRFHPLNMFLGLSPIEALATVAVGDLKMQDWNANFFGEDNAKLPGALAFSDMINNSDWEVIKRDIRADWGGTNRSGPMLLRGVGAGGVNWMQMGLTQQDMEFLGGRQFTKEEIYGLFAPGLSSVLDVNATEANARSGKATMIEMAVWPDMVSIAEKITNDILPCYDRRSPRSLVCMFDDIRPEDRDLRLREQESAERVLSLDEVRERFYDLPPLPRGVVPAARGAESPALSSELSESVKAQLQPAEESLYHRLRLAIVNGDDLTAVLYEPLRAAMSGELALKRPDIAVLRGVDLPFDTWHADALLLARSMLDVALDGAPPKDSWFWLISLVVRIITWSRAYVLERLAEFIRDEHALLADDDREPLYELVWSTSQDDRVCPICEPLDGIPEADIPGGMRPGAVHPFCRCSWELRPVMYQSEGP